MDIFHPNDMDELSTFTNKHCNLTILKRNKPHGSEAFFQKLMQIPFKVTGLISIKDPIKNIHDILYSVIPENLREDSFYDDWLNDMSEICKAF
jgi:hypothetical protein